MSDKFTWDAGQFVITRPRGEKFAWGAGDFKIVAVPDQKYSDDEPRDEHGRWGDGGGATWYHGTSEELKPGDVLTPGHEVRHGENDKVWVSDNAYQASKYGAFVYEVHPHAEPVGRQKANHEFSTVGAHVVGTVPESVIREHSNQMAQEAADYDHRHRKDVKYSADQPRDDHGRFGEGSTFYHGSPHAGLTSVAARVETHQYDNATSQFGAFVTDDPKYAEHYAGKGGTVYEAAVTLQNPYHMDYAEFNYFQSPDKDANGKALPGGQWVGRAAALRDEAAALRTRLESEGHDGIVVKGSGMRPTEVASFSDIALTHSKGEGAGHEFRGNRWTGGVGSEGRQTWNREWAAGEHGGKSFETETAHVDVVNPIPHPTERVFVGGSRGFVDLDMIRAKIDTLPQTAVLVTSRTFGASAAVRDIAIEQGRPMEVWSARLEKFPTHEAAYFARDEEMVRSSDRIVEFWDHISTGTAHEITYAQSLDKPVDLSGQAKGAKGEGTGHGFRGNRWTGGISGEGRQTTTPRAKRGDKVGPYKPRASKLTYEKMTAGQREAVHHIVVNMQRATAWGMRASEWANRPIGGPEPVSRPLHPDDRNSVIGAIKSLEAAGIDHEQLVRALTYDAASNRMGHSGSGNAGAYTVQQYSQDLQSLEHSEKPDFNPAELVPSKIELSRAEALAQEVMKPINEVRMAAVAKESQGSHLAEGLKDPTKFPAFARESLTAVAKLAERDRMLYNDHIPEEGKNLDRMYAENHAALMAVGRDVQTEIDRRIVSIPPPDPVKVEELNARVTQANLDVVRAHEAYMTRYAATYAVRSETGWKTLPPSDPTYIAKSEEYERIGREILGLRDEYDRLSGIRDKAVMEQVGLTRPDRLASGRIAIQVLSEIRPFGYDLKDHVGTTSVSKPNPPRVAVASFQAATAYFPREWYERAFGRVLPGNGQRQRMNIGVSARPSGSRAEVTTYRGTGESVDSTSVHETGHFMEDVGGRSITQAEYQFMLARTTNADGTREQTRTLDATNRAAGLGRWTRASDRSYQTYTDKFASVYMGKLYGGGGPNSNYELLTMGMENLRNPTSNSPKTDAEYKAFILGVLATL